MQGARTRVIIDDAYVEALGRAAYAFAVLEWNAIWCCERMDPSYMLKPGRARSKKRTAGEIAADLVRLVKNHPDPKVQTACLAPAKEFVHLVEVRNRILHGKPARTSAGEHRLFHDGIAWTPAMINDEADNFAECGELLNKALHNVLM